MNDCSERSDSLCDTIREAMLFFLGYILVWAVIKSTSLLQTSITIVLSGNGAESRKQAGAPEFATKQPESPETSQAGLSNPR